MNSNDNEGRNVRGGGSLFSEAERKRYRGKVDQPPQIYRADMPKDDPALMGAARGPRFSINRQGAQVVTPDGVTRAARFALDPRSRTVLYLALGVVVAYVAAAVLPSNIFDVNNTRLSFAWFLNVTGRNVANIATLVTGGGAFGGIDFKLCRLAIVGLAGAALALSGAAYQGSLKNRLASPSTLGVMSGAQLGAIVYILLAASLPLFGYTQTGETISQVSESLFGDMSLAEYLWAISQRSVFTLGGSLIVVGCVLGIARLAGRGRTSRVAMVITGQVFAACISSFIVVVRMYLQTYGTQEQMDALQYTLLGGFDAVFTPLHLCLVGVPVVACMAIVLSLRNKLNLLAFGEDEARSMGLSVASTRIALIACCTILTAVVVAFCGPVGYVGFLVPHMARRIVGPDFKYLLAASALIGAVFLIVVYALFTEFTIPTGSISTVTTLAGVVLFVVTLVRQRRNGYAGW